MAAYPNAIDKIFGGIPGIMFRDLIEHDLGQRSLKGERKILWAIHCWIVAENPQEKDPSDKDVPLPDLIKLNDEDLKKLVFVNKYDTDVPVDDVELNRCTLALEGIEIRMKEIIKRGKLIDNVKPGQGPAIPL